MMKVNLSLFTLLFGLGFGLGSCSDDEPPVAENEEEVIDKVTLTFTPDDGNDPVVQSATDPDGTGVKSMQVDGPVNLRKNTVYTLTLKLENTAEKEDVTEEIEEEKDEHMFFFSFTDDIFSDPAGNGNIDNRSDKINYSDKDSKTLPVGLTTTWETGTSPSSDGFFRVVLKHQPEGIKTTTSTSTDGESDIDIKWVINIE